MIPTQCYLHSVTLFFIACNGRGMDKWDASLIFVMVGAHLMVLPFYHSVIKPMWDNGKGQSLRGKPFGLPPTNGKVDAKVSAPCQGTQTSHKWTNCTPLRHVGCSV